MDFRGPIAIRDTIKDMKSTDRTRQIERLGTVCKATTEWFAQHHQDPDVLPGI